MRIIGNIEHPVLKITVFKMDMRITVKFEDANFEQGFKFRMSDQLAHFEDVKRLVDEKFITDVIESLKAQQHTRISAMDRFIQLNPDDEFDVIV